MFTDICIMHILLIAATRNEIQGTLSFFEPKKNRAGNHELQIAITGIGLVSTAYSLTKHIYERRPDMVIQAGISGCFINNKNTAVFAVNEDVVADMLVRENDLFKNIFDLKLADRNAAPYTDGVLINPYRKLLSISAIGQVKAISVNEITTDKEKMEWYQQNFAPVVESMEGAALHFVCLQEKIPFLQIRAVSNYIGERDKSKWNIKESIHNLNEYLILLLNKLTIYDETYFRL